MKTILKVESFSIITCYRFQPLKILLLNGLTAYRRAEDICSVFGVDGGEKATAEGAKASCVVGDGADHELVILQRILQRILQYNYLAFRF